jgi:selenide,water dikinase
MQVLHQLPVPHDPNLILGGSGTDDAAVYKISDDIALVQTVDYFTPIVDDPYTFGAIAAANALSDVYAMGVKPVMALNIVGFPVNELSLDILVEILRGGADKAKEAGIPIAGGHSIEDKEPKYGLVVTGLAHPDRIMTNSGAKPGDVLILTKPIGTGIIATAVKAEVAAQESIDAAVKVMSTLNRAAAECMMKIGVNSCTDVTGFGLLGHLYEMISASGVGAEVSYGKVPLIPGTWELADDLIIPAGTSRNHEYLGDYVIWGGGVEYEEQMILCDAQTSGGLLISVPEEKGAALIESLEGSGALAAARIGKITEDMICKIRVSA